METKLALFGGDPLVTSPLPIWPSFDLRVLEDISTLLLSGQVNYWTGSVGKQFEQQLASYLGDGYVITTTNGTSALHTALSALGIGSGDEVICPAYTFIATAFSVMQAGALPIFADVNQSHTIDPASIVSRITPRTKAIVVVHTYGVVADMAEILRIAAEHQLLVIEDCAQALGAEFQGKKVGTLGDAGCFSFCQSKHFTTGGEGGAVFVASEDLAWKCRSFRDHGYDVEKRIELMELEDKFYYIHPRIGFNYRMTEMQSAIGLKELARFEKWNLPLRRKNGQTLLRELQHHPFVRQVPLDDLNRSNSYWWAPLGLDMQQVRCNIDELVLAINAEGVPAYTVPWPEIYREEAFTKQQGFGQANYPFADPAHQCPDYTLVQCEVSRQLGQHTVIFPMHPVFSSEDIRNFAAALDKVYRHFKK